MIKIILCDDNRQTLTYYQSILSETAAENGIDVKLLRCESGEQLLFHLSDDPNRADIIYLDILMGKMNGIETAKRLRELGCTSLIIYLTTSNEYVFESFDVAPYYYIVKDEMSAKKFKEIFLKAVSAIQDKQETFISISRGAATEKIALDRIYFFEIRNRVITVHTTTGDIDFYATLEEVEQTLAERGFVRIHRSYLVNCHYIEKLHRTQLLLTDGTELPVSTKYSQAVQHRFSKYLLQI